MADGGTADFASRLPIDAGRSTVQSRSFAAILLLLTTLLPGCATQAPRSLTANDSPADITGSSYRLEPAYYVVVHVPKADADKILAAVVAAVGLEYGKYDQVAYLDAPGLEQFRPLTGSKSGAEASAGREPTISVSFSIPRNSDTLRKALDAVYSSHSYEEPVIYIMDVLRTRSTNPDESNPNRWWNQRRQ